MWKKMQVYYILIVSNFVIRPQILIFSVLEKWEIFPHTDCKQNFSCYCSFRYFLFRSICGTENSPQQTSLQCLSTVNMVFRNENKILITKVCIWRGTQQREKLDKGWCY